MTEEEFKANVLELARTLGWRIHHDRPARVETGWRTAIEGDPGFPDLVLAKAGRLIIAELKSDTGKLSADQLRWITELVPQNHPPKVDIWRPGDIQEIADLLGPKGLG